MGCTHKRRTDELPAFLQETEVTEKGVPFVYFAYFAVNQQFV
jgi:hypothetical protein